MPEKVRVVIVDDHAIVRRGLRALLDLVEDIEVVGEAGDGAEAVATVAACRPDVVLMDLVMPRQDGIAATAAIKANDPEVDVIALTSFVAEEKVVAALEAGATGYVLKDADEHQVISAIRAAHGGEMQLDPAVTRLLAERLRHRDRTPHIEPLTEREVEVLALLGQGLSNKQIAAELSIADCTARTHVSNLLGKLGLASRTQAALYAVERGMASRAPSGA